MTTSTSSHGLDLGWCRVEVDCTATVLWKFLPPVPFPWSLQMTGSSLSWRCCVPTCMYGYHLAVCVGSVSHRTWCLVVTLVTLLLLLLLLLDQVCGARGGARGSQPSAHPAEYPARACGPARGQCPHGLRDLFPRHIRHSSQHYPSQTAGATTGTVGVIRGPPRSGLPSYVSPAYVCAKRQGKRCANPLWSCCSFFVNPRWSCGSFF